MAAANYPFCLKQILKYEGGYTNDAADPGGPTNFGITIIDARKYWKADASAADVRSMPLSAATTIYKAHYWDAVRGDDLPDGVDLATFDPAVNSGVGRSNIWLGQALGTAKRDYPTLATLATAAKDKAAVCRAICQKRLSFLHALRTWSVFGKGWGSRVANVQALSVTMAQRAAGQSAEAITASHQKVITQTKTKQGNDLALTTLSQAPQTAIHSFWHWDLLHVGGSVLLASAVIYGLWRVVQNYHLIQAYEAAIKEIKSAG